LKNMNAKTIRLEEGEKLNLMGDAVRIILRAEDTGGTLTLVQQRSSPGAGIPLHVNTREDEIFQVLEGQVEFHVGDQTLVAENGTVVYAPRHVPHSFRVVGTAPALLQITMTPGGLEKMVEEIVKLTMPPDPQKIGAICERYGVKFMHH
jgi:quercetin dioxygenase-like cupin family protein